MIIFNFRHETTFLQNILIKHFVSSKNILSSEIIYSLMLRETFNCKNKYNCIKSWLQSCPWKANICSLQLNLVPILVTLNSIFTLFERRIFYWFQHQLLCVFFHSFLNLTLFRDFPAHSILFPLYVSFCLFGPFDQMFI